MGKGGRPSANDITYKGEKVKRIVNGSVINYNVETRRRKNLREEFDRKLKSAIENYNKSLTKVVQDEVEIPLETYTVNDIVQNVENKIRYVIIQNIDNILVKEGPGELDVEKLINNVIRDKVLEDNVQGTINNMLNDVVQNFNVLTEKEYSEFKGGLETYKITTTSVQQMIDENIPVEEVKEYILGNIESLEEQANDFYNKADEYRERNEEAHKEYLNAGKVLDNEAELLRLKFNIKPKERRTIDRIKKEVDINPLVSLEKFKKYIRENWKEIGLIASLALGTVGMILNSISISRNRVKK